MILSAGFGYRQLWQNCNLAAFTDQLCSRHRGPTGFLVPASANFFQDAPPSLKRDKRHQSFVHSCLAVCRCDKTSSFLHRARPVSAHGLKRAPRGLFLYGRAKVIAQKDSPDQEGQADLIGTCMGHSQDQARRSYKSKTQSLEKY